ncbi:hypothetical protein J4402_01140 [Candidatus Pacearchaeota archaeon]|nr:hypothetical protein [Candidatus Pacearchaeota archaeon]
MAKNNYLLLFLIFLGLTIILGIIVIYQFSTANHNLTSEDCPVCVTCPVEKALMEAVLSTWGENIYDSSENLLEVDVTNYGYVEGKNVEITCNIFKADEDGVIIGDNPVDKVTKSIGNVASTSYKQVELKAEQNTVWGLTPLAACYVSACDSCEILYKRIPDLAEVYKSP